MIKIFLQIAFILVAINLKSFSQEKDILLIVDFDNKTIDTIGNYIYLHSAWDSDKTGIIKDPDDPHQKNNVFTWEKNATGQLHGGFIFHLFDQNGIDLTTWEYIAFRIRGSKPFGGVNVKLQKPHEIGVFYGESRFEANPETWYDVRIKLKDIVAPPHNNPALFKIFPAGSEDVNALFYFDDLRLERPRLIPVTKISFNDSDLSLNKGNILHLIPMIEPQDATNLHLARWKSLNEDVVLVSSRGLISVVGKGEAIVTLDIAGVESSVRIVSE